MQRNSKHVTFPIDNNLPINQTIPQNLDVPDMLEDTQIPRLNNAVRQVYESLHPYQPKHNTRVKGTLAGPKLVNN